jgi:hypothetical protein
MTMKINFPFGIAIVFLLSACAHRPTAHAIKSQCRLEMQAARTAVQLREQGKTKQAMLQSLPPLHPDSTRLLRQMYQIVEETYAYPSLNDIVYGVYRFEACARQLQLQLTPPPLQTVAPQLLACQNRFGRQVSKAAVTCVHDVFAKDSKSKTVTQEQDN